MYVLTHTHTHSPCLPRLLLLSCIDPCCSCVSAATRVCVCVCVCVFLQTGLAPIVGSSSGTLGSIGSSAAPSDTALAPPPHVSVTTSSPPHGPTRSQHPIAVVAAAPLSVRTHTHTHTQPLPPCCSCVRACLLQHVCVCVCVPADWFGSHRGFEQWHPWLYW
jgi:hypothetical protein